MSGSGKSWYNDYVNTAQSIWCVYMSPVMGGKMVVLRSGLTMFEGVAFMQQVRPRLPVGVELNIAKIT